LDDTRGTVLVIDDDQDMRWAIRTILAETGIEVAEASAGEGGLELAARCAPDAVLLDIQMPASTAKRCCAASGTSKRTCRSSW